MLGDKEGIRTTEKGKDVADHQVSDKSDDDSGPPPGFDRYRDFDDDEYDDDSGPLPGFERYRDFDDLPMDADAGQNNDDEMNSAIVVLRAKRAAHGSIAIIEGAPNDRTSVDSPMTPIERQMQVIATNIQDLAREISRQNQELRQAIKKGPPTPRDNNQPPPRGENGSNDQEADSRQVTRRRADEVEKTPPQNRHRAESTGSSAHPSLQRTVRITRSSKQPKQQDQPPKKSEQHERSSKQPEGSARSTKQLDHSSRQPNHLARSSRGPDDKTTRLEEELHEMRKQMGDMKNSLKAKAACNLDNLVHRADSPFIPSIANFPLPSRFKAVPEEIMCRAFPMGLRGSARVWFNKLESESIGSFIQLSRAFIDHFISAKKIDRPKEDVTVTAFMAGLRKGDFLYDLCKDPPETLSELMYEAQKHMNAEDALEAMDDPPPKRRKETEVRKQEPAKQKVSKFTETPERKRTTTPPVKFSSFTPLNTPIDKLLLQIQDDPSLRWPGKIRSDPNSRPKNLYCRFHRDHRHLTEDCVALKEQVETLIRQGKLQKYVSRSSNSRPTKPPIQKEQTENNKPGPVHNIMVVQRPLKNARLNDQVTSFSEEDARGTHQPHDDALVVTINIAGFTTRRVMVDNGSSADILYLPAYQQMRLDKDQLRPMDAPLVGFTEDKVCPVGIVTLPITLDTIELEDRHPEKTTKIGANLPPKMKESLVQFLKNNKDVFAWSHEDMSGINPSIISHKLNVNPTFRPIKRKRRVFAPERNNAIMEEVDKLLMANFIREVFYPDWLANVVMVKKNTGKWRMIQPDSDGRERSRERRPSSQAEDFSAIKNVEVYVDDMLVKSKEEGDHLDDLREMFETLRKYQMKLNPKRHRSKPRQDQGDLRDATTKNHQRNPKDDGKSSRTESIHVSINRQVPALLQDTEESIREELYLYLAVSPTAVSSTLIKEEERRQLPVYYTIRALRGAVERYPPMEKLALALVIAAKKLLPEFDIDYRPRTEIKAQALADFLAEFTSKDDEPMEDIEQTSKWTANIDGSSTKNAGGIGIVLKSPKGDIIKQAVRLQYSITNNKAEYEALLTELKMAKILGAAELDVLSDSQLVVGQVNEDYEAKEGRMRQYLNLVQHQISRFREVRLSRIPREQNTEVDQLAKSASSSILDGKIKIVKQSSLQATKGILYKRSFSLPYLRCLAPDEAKYVMREIHKGICGNYLGARALQKKIVRAGYYWPSMQADANKFVQYCDKCQRFANLLHSPPKVLVPMMTPWPFAQWGLDIMGLFPIGRRQLKFLVVAIDYFTKWVEAEPLATIIEKNIQSFVWKAVICRFGIPRVLVSDNGKQFDNPRFRTTVRIPTGETPFQMTYGNEAVVLVEIGLTTLRTSTYDDQQNEEQLRLNLDLIDEVRDTAKARMKRYQEKMARH
uniref:Uncharacterized protein n=1 Tax=Fagus sylvatica TaxID=28930 RepID=A0A2N9F3F9_FAGSY